MKIAYTGRRYFSDYDLDTIKDRVTLDVQNPEVDELFFGGAIGSDSHALRFAYLARGASSRGPTFTVVCPDTQNNLPLLARNWAEKYADKIIELQHPVQRSDGYRALFARNEWLVDTILECGQLEAFWDNRREGGTWSTIEYAIGLRAAWEHIPILGVAEEAPR